MPAQSVSCDGEISVVHSHWSRSNEARLSLVKSFIVLLRQCLLCHKEPACYIQSPLLGAFACSLLVLYGTRDTTVATLSTNESRACYDVDQWESTRLVVMVREGEGRGGGRIVNSNVSLLHRSSDYTATHCITITASSTQLKIFHKLKIFRSTPG